MQHFIYAQPPMFAIAQLSVRVFCGTQAMSKIPVFGSHWHYGVVLIFHKVLVNFTVTFAVTHVWNVTA